jgi:hypothetical protein
MNFNWEKIERTVGGMKFAVVVIILFTICMITGTFFESYFGTDFAKRTIYMAPFFMILQVCMFLSIIFAAFLRLPPKKRLYGFYTIHSGLVIVGIGSLITYIAGVDGQMYLPPNDTTRMVVLSKDIFKITYPDEGTQSSTFLPFTAFETEMDQKYRNITLKKFLPFGEGKLSWIDALDQYPDNLPRHSSQYHYKNAFAEQDITLSLHPEATTDFPSTSSMGPLTFNYLPEKVFECFKNVKASKVIFLNSKTAECFTPEDRHIAGKMNANKQMSYVVPYNGQKLNFTPEISATPIDQGSDLKVMNLVQFEQKPTLFLFGKKASFYSKAPRHII